MTDEPTWLLHHGYQGEVTVTIGIRVEADRHTWISYHPGYGLGRGLHSSFGHRLSSRLFALSSWFVALGLALSLALGLALGLALALALGLALSSRVAVR